MALRERVRVVAMLLLDAAFASQAVERPAGATGSVAQVLRDEVLERVANEFAVKCASVMNNISATL